MAVLECTNCSLHTAVAAALSETVSLSTAPVLSHCHQWSDGTSCLSTFLDLVCATMRQPFTHIALLHSASEKLVVWWLSRYQLTTLALAPTDIRHKHWHCSDMSKNTATDRVANFCYRNNTRPFSSNQSYIAFSKMDGVQLMCNFATDIQKTKKYSN